MTTVSDAAIYYSLCGFQPFAVRPNEKRPLYAGWQTAAFDKFLEAISDNPGANVGIAVPRGMMVLDVDTKNNGQATLAALEVLHGPLPNTLTATTPTGGKHIWLRLPSGVDVGNYVSIAPGLDVRTNRGYVVAPPSVINGRAYVWDNWRPENDELVIAEAPGWLISLVNSPKETPRVATGEELVIPEGMRNRTLFEAAAAMRAKGCSHNVIQAAISSMNAESCNPPLDDSEVASIASSASSYAPDTQPWKMFANPGALPVGALPVATAQTAERRFKLLSGEDVCNAPPMRWMVHGLLPMGGLGVLYGPSGSGKSFLILDLGCAVAGGGAEWFGRRVTKAPVIYVCLEGEAGMEKRLKAWRQHHNKPVSDAMRFVMQPFDLRTDVPDLAKAVIAAGGAGGMVIVDTLNRAAPGADENSSVDMGKLIDSATQLQRLVGGLVLLVHHTGKDETKGMRGHSSLYAAIDTAIEVSKTDSRRVWSVAKSKDEATDDAYPFKLEIVQVGSDGDGIPITSCVAVPDKSCGPIKAKKVSLGANQKIALEVLKDFLRQSPCAGMEGVPPGYPCINYDEAVSIVAIRMPTDAKHKRSSAKTAIQGLIEKKHLDIWGDWLWAIQ